MLGVCQPLELARDQGGLLVLLLDDQFVYWGGDGAVIGKRRIDNTGDTLVFAAQKSAERAYAAALTSDNLLWANDFQDKGIRGCQLPDCLGGPTLLIPAATPPGALTYSVASKTLFWAQSTSIWSKPLPSGTAAQFLSTKQQPFGLISDELFVYWDEYDATSQKLDLRKASLTGGPSSSLAARIPSIASMASHDKTLFVLTGATAGKSQILGIPLPNGIGDGALPVFATAGATGRALAVDDSGVYWTEQSASDGAIRHCPLSGCEGEPEIIAPSAAPWAITTDAKAIYWSTSDGFVMKLAK